MKITYIHHSSFCIEFEDEKVILIFDYYKGELPEFDKDSYIFMFVSHKHFDHYSRKIYELGEEYEHIAFILPKDMKMNENYLNRWKIPVVSRSKIKYVASHETYDFMEASNGLSQLHVKTLKSTDAGVAYLVECFGKSIYHAGDLNWWVWNELPEAKNADMAERFKKEIDMLSGMSFDVAFLPLDPRQEDKFYWGFDYFMTKCKVNAAFPMHLWEKYEIIDQLKEMQIADHYRDRIVDITNEGQIFRL